MNKTNDSYDSNEDKKQTTKEATATAREPLTQPPSKMNPSLGRHRAVWANAYLFVQSVDSACSTLSKPNPLVKAHAILSDCLR